MKTTTPPLLQVRVLSVRQPWAWAIIHGGKDVENRDWLPRIATPPFLMLIHAGHTYEQDAESVLYHRGLIQVPHTELARTGGRIIGAVTVPVAGIITNSVWADSGSWNWQLTNPVPADPPIVFRGVQHLAEPPLQWWRSFPGRWCWCHATHGLAAAATAKSNGVGPRASVANDICGACAGRSATACRRVHSRELTHFSIGADADAVRS